MDVAVVRYKGVEILIPPKEMMVHTGQVPSGPEYAVWLAQVSRILNARLDTDIDFVVRNIDNADRTVVGSRRDTARRKRKRLYLDTDELGRHMIEEGSVVQARVVSVAEKALRAEVFGVECNVAANARVCVWRWQRSQRSEVELRSQSDPPLRGHCQGVHESGLELPFDTPRSSRMSLGIVTCPFAITFALSTNTFVCIVRRLLVFVGKVGNNLLFIKNIAVNRDLSRGRWHATAEPFADLQIS